MAPLSGEEQGTIVVAIIVVFGKALYEGSNDIFFFSIL